VAGLLRSKRIPSVGSDSGLKTDEIGALVAGELEKAAAAAR